MSSTPSESSVSSSGQVRSTESGNGAARRARAAVEFLAATRKRLRGCRSRGVAISGVSTSSVRYDRSIDPREVVGPAVVIAGVPSAVGAVAKDMRAFARDAHDPRQSTANGVNLEQEGALEEIKLG